MSEINPQEGFYNSLDTFTNTEQTWNTSDFQALCTMIDRGFSKITNFKEE